MDVVRCAACGEENPGRARFCLACGTPIDAGPRASGGREVRKTLTVLFVDVVGFTSLGERLDQESLRRVMDRFYDEMRGAIEGQGGTVAKFIGDAVMAVWGTPTMNEDDALRAVRAAEDMRRALAPLNEDLEARWGVRLGLRTGVNTGEVVVDPAKPADLLVGDAVNVAARLEQAAAPGEVLVGGETYRLVRDDARLEPVPAPLELKGKGRPVEAFRLIDGTPRERRRQGRLQAPLVGRERELARLRAALDAATAASETRVVTLIGSPGVGKTRLVQDFAGDLGEGATVVTGHCEAAGEGLTFLPIAEVVRSGAGIHEGDSAESATHKLAAVLGDDPARDRVVERVLGLLGLGAPVSVEETFWAVRRFLEGLARLRPLVVLLDDLHWGQPTFLDLVEHLAAWGRHAPVLVVLLARPELREVRPALTERNEAVSEVIGLGPLPPAESRALVDRLLGEADLPPELADRVLETTEGNPLFLGEMLRMLVDDGVLQRSGDRWVMPTEPGAVFVPPTVQALLAARIERLSDAERSVVERAAVIGQQFYVGAVAALAQDEGGPDVADHLARLRRKELVAPEGTLWEGEEVYRFHHVLIRDAAYRSLLKEARADLHERFAGWLEERTGEHEELIALHLERAHAYREQLGPLDERGRRLAERAARRLHAAGRRALQREDLPAARNLLERALHPLTADAPARLDVLADLAEAQLSAGDTAAAEETVEELALRAEATAERRLHALATAYACQLAMMTGAGHVHETIVLAGEAADALAAAGDPAGEAKAHHVAAQAHSLLGEIAAAEAALDRALTAARSAKDRRRVTAVLSSAPRAALWGPSTIVRASGRCLDVVRILRMSPGNRHVEAAALRCQAVLEAMRGRPQAAREIVAGCRATLEELGLTLELHELDVYAGIVELLAGEPAAAERDLRRAREGFAALGVDSSAAQAAALLARALVEQSRFHEADEQTRHAERHAGEDLKTGIVWRGVRAESLARRGDHAEAERLAREAVAVAEPTDALADKADALMALATVLRTAGRPDDAREAALRALELYRAKEHTIGEMRARAAIGVRVASAGAGVRTRVELGEREAARLWRAYAAAFAANDWDGLREIVADDIVLVDHRALGWEAISGIEPFLDAQRAGAAVASAARLEAHRVLEVDDEAIALVCALEAEPRVVGGATEVLLGVVVHAREGRVDLVELFAPDDEDAIRARFDELRSRLPVPEHWHRYCALVNARDWRGLRAMLADDHTLVDHRQVAWGAVDDPDALIDVHRTATEVSPLTVAVEAVLAADPGAGVDAVRLLARGGAEGGPAETSYGVVAVLRGGRLAHVDLFAPEDDERMLARYEELRARAGRRPVSPLSRERIGAWASAAAEGRFEDVLEAPGYVFVDHRLGGAGTVGTVGPDSTPLRSAHAAAQGLHFAVDPLAGLDDGVTDVRAARVVVSGSSRDGGGRFEVPYATVNVAGEEGAERVEMFEPDDAAALRRFDELCAETFDGVTLSPLAAEPIPSSIVARQRRWAGAFNAHDWETVTAMWDEDVVRADHRRLGWEAVRDRAAFAEDAAAFAASTLDPHVRIELVAGSVAGDRWVFAALIQFGGTSRDGGGPATNRMGWVIAGRGERSTEHAVFDDAAVDAMLARYDELRTAMFSGGWLDALDARDWAAARALLHDDMVVVDHRQMGWGSSSGGDRILAFTRSIAEMSPDARWGSRLLDQHQQDRRAVERVLLTVSGTSDGAPWELTFVSVGVIVDGLRTRFEFFDVDDEEASAARFEELRAGIVAGAGA